ncbi:RING finger protein 207 [Centrocercus urophasianus]|uniref:RING finger protein 207 n=1 Tax=Centrocercus urophasianus TaxID=9002 RepID=UPI001C653387|nr:RING finger protein 207 [Centrocercus urophasianus]XP_052547600.1 RING finger protein 207 isoform X1 [Tympanuchus pallidicinctus]
MAGGIFSPLGSCAELEQGAWHPLVCLLCHGPFQQPCLLDCYHAFCASCLRGRAASGRLRCPLCGHPSVVRGGTGLPPVDRLLQFLVDSSAEGSEDAQCANCDRRCAEADLDTMCFCNTCSQPLCAPCREETHRAKVFARHEIVSLSKRTKAIHKKCPLHEEPYIMFSTEKKSMLCINCFRDMQGESRAHCIDIETAYVQGCEKLDQAVLAVKELQTSTREAIVLLKAMIEEVRNSASEEESAINALFSGMQEQLSDRKKALLKAVQSQHEEKEKAFKEQLAHLASLLPTLQVHLVICSAFLSSANKAEFLDLGYQLMERLQRIVKLPHRLRPAQTSKINTEYRAEFARCLEPLLVLTPRRSVVGSAGGIGSGITGANMIPGGQCSKTLMVPGCPPAGDKMSSSSMVRKPTLHRYISTKVLLAEGRETPFAEHCRNYENTYRMLQAEIQGLKDQVQELHRDLTKHHSLIRTEIMSEILQKSLQMDVQIAAHYSSVEMMRSVFEEVWEETYQRVANEQEIYEAQLHDLLQLRQENSCLTTITKQIAPYVRSIAKVKERLEPRLQEPREPKDEHTQMLLRVDDSSEAAQRDSSPGGTDSRERALGSRGGCTPALIPGDSPPKKKEHRGSAQSSGTPSAERQEPPGSS